MQAKDILESLGQFSPSDIALFEKYATLKTLAKNEILLEKGSTCSALYYVLSGAFFQFQTKDVDETIIDLHVSNEWMYNHQSLIEQNPSSTTLKAYAKSEILELTLENYHLLASRSAAFLQMNKILNQAQNRTHLFDNALNPAESYAYLKKAKPQALKIFPIKMIASFLKIAPETLSRVRSKN